MGCEMCCELDGLGRVGAELEGGDGDAVRAGVSVRFENTASVHDFCVPFALLGIYAYTSEWSDCCSSRGGGGGELRLRVGWGTGKRLP